MVMKSQICWDKPVGILATGLLLLAGTVCPMTGEAALPTHPVLSASATDKNPKGTGPVAVPKQVTRPETGRENRESVADKIWNKVRNGSVPGESAQNSRPPQTSAAAGDSNQQTNHSSAPASVQEEHAAYPDPATPMQVPTGYTEAEIREQMIKKYTRPRPAFRRVSGADAGTDYRPGTMDVKIPVLFFPADEVKDVSENFQVNPDGTLGTKTFGNGESTGREYSVAAQKQIQEMQKQKPQPAGKNREGNALSGQQRHSSSGAAGARQKYKTITVQVNVPAPSPFRQLISGDFRWFTNSKGHYVFALPHSLPQDPLKGLPAEGPMVIRAAAQNEFMAVSMDDPGDTYYYKNSDTFPTYGKAKPVFTETRKSIQGNDVDIKYIRYFISGQYCLIVDGSFERAGKTCRAAVVFPESKQYEYLPKALYVMENLKAI